MDFHSAITPYVKFRVSMTYEQMEKLNRYDPPSDKLKIGDQQFNNNIQRPATNI